MFEIPVVKFTVESISAIVGLALMLFFAYTPVLRVKYAALASEVKSYIMLGLLILAGVIIGLLTMYGVIPSTEPLTWGKVIEVFLALLVANQPTYQIAPQTADVKQAIFDRNVKVALLLKKPK